jgi:hypothetical protein
MDAVQQMIQQYSAVGNQIVGWHLSTEKATLVPLRVDALWQSKNSGWGMTTSIISTPGTPSLIYYLRSIGSKIQSQAYSNYTGHNAAQQGFLWHCDRTPQCIGLAEPLCCRLIQLETRE